MKVSLNHVKKYIDIDLPPVGELVDRINRQLGGVEEVIDLSDKYKDVIIVEVVSVEKHPDADKLSVTKVNDGGAWSDVGRDSDGLVQVVCGAPNVKAGMMTAWLPPNSTVPASYSDDEPFVLTPKELRGVLSQGMLAAADELDLGSDHDGIIEIHPSDKALDGSDVKPGDKFAEAYGLDDTIIDIENKMFTHRPDLFGQIGVAREISAILGGVTSAEDGVVDSHFVNPDEYWKIPDFESVKHLDLDVFNDAEDKVSRAMFVAMKDIEVAPSPMWLKCALVALGGKPVNNIVDATNYIMLLTAQPTHAYDYDKIRGNKIGARMARDGEKIKLLNDKEYELTSDDIVIADGEGAIGLAGIMGGSDSEVDSTTKNIILEVATFDMYAVRKTSMRHGVFTDALARFNKGQSPLQNSRIISMLMSHVSAVSGVSQASDVYDVPKGRWEHVESVHDSIKVSRDFINDRLGVDLTLSQIGNLLRRANFASWPDGNDENKLIIHAPFWRTDIAIPEDIVEEVGRLYDFGKLPRELPLRSTSPTPRDSMISLKSLIRDALSGAGANEVLAYSFVHSNLIKQSGQSIERAYQLSNALSPDLHYMRLSLQPSILDKVYSNIRDGHDEFAMFEIGKSHDKNHVGEDGLPHEFNRLALVYTNKQNQTSSPYYNAKRMLDYLSDKIGISLSYANVELDDDQIGAMFEIKRRAAVIDSATGGQIGVVGEYSTGVKKAFKLPEASAGFEINLDNLLDYVDQTHGYQPLSRYPSAERDVCFKLSDDVQYETLVSEVHAQIDKFDIGYDVSPLDIYQADGDSTKNITVRIKLTPRERTLSGAEIDQVVNGASIQVCQKLNAEII